MQNWQYSKVGPAGYYLKDGTQVEGWRFAIGTASASDPKPANLDWSTYCGKNTYDSSKTYRVLLVVDYGTMSGAPKGPVYSCYAYSASDNANGYTVVSHHPVRENGGLVCAIDNYPRTGCGEVVSSPAPAVTHTPTPTPTPTHVSTTTSRPSPTKSATPRRSRAPTVLTSTPTPTPTPTPTTSALAFDPRRSESSPPPYGVIAGAAGAVVLTVGAWRLQRRRPR